MAVNEDPLPTPSFPEKAPTDDEDDYVIFEGVDVLAIYSAAEDGVQLDDTLNYTQSTLLIYAETVFLNSKTIKIPGKNLGIFCNQLVLSLNEACIDVSGDKGAASSSDTVKAGSGGSGGSVWLYVEDTTQKVRDNLVLKAYGGDGGRGMDGTKGGEGGDGGACGMIKCYLGSAVLRYTERLHDATMSQKWAAWVRDIGATVADDGVVLLDSKVDRESVNSWNSVITDMLSCLDAVDKLQGALGRLLNRPTIVKPGEDLAKKTASLRDALTKFGSNDNGPGVPGKADKDALVKLADDCDKFFGASAMKQKLLLAMDDALLTVANLTPSKPGTSKLLDALDAINSALKSVFLDQPAAFARSCCLLAGGEGGRGGSGTTAGDPSGKPGQDQPSNAAEARFVSFSGLEMDLEIDQAIACPEQCQMILNKADALYFTGTRPEVLQAMQLYNRLQKRLAFSDLLNDDEGKKSPLYTALDHFENTSKLSFAVVSQLDSILQTARRRLNCIVLNQDMWEHADVWVPRLSLAYYDNRVSKMISDYEKLETTYTTYAKMEQKAQMTANQVAEAQRSNNAMLQATQDGMARIINDGGELQLAGQDIVLGGQRMAAARIVLSAGLQEYHDKIQNHFNITTDTILDALSTLSMAPEGFTAIVQAADIAHKSWSKIEDAQGTSISKDYVVKEITTCQGSIASLSQTYENLDASNLKSNDPGYAKIMTTTEDLSKILDDFEEQVPVDKVKASLAAYVDLATKRNTAVISYNGLVQTYLRLKSIEKSCMNESARLGEKAVTLNKALPAIYFWLKRLKWQSHLRILQELNSQARALSFWGPMPVNSVTFDTPGPKDGSEQLLQYQQQIIDKFETSYNGFQGGGWSSWPPDREFVGEGYWVPLSSQDLADLTTAKPTAEAPDGSAASTHELLLTIKPQSNDSFLGMANVRLTQVRVWLRGATVSPDRDEPVGVRHELHVVITHCGDETIWAPDGTACQFRHTPVAMDFSYETTIYNREGKRSGREGLVYGRQDIQNDYAGGSSRPGAGDKPPIGPFGDWKIEIKKDGNPGLDLSHVTEGSIEFCGRNQVLNDRGKGFDY